MLSRRQFLLGAGAGMATAVYSPRLAHSRGAGATQTIVLTATAMHLGQYLYLPFEVPGEVNRIDISVTKQGDAITGVGLFDQRGAGYQSAGFRGIYGEERSQLFVAADSASQAFIPGVIQPGTWTVIIPVFRATVPTVVTVTVVLTFGAQPAAFEYGAPPDVVLDEPGWYRGDLHCHTPESSDAWSSDSALTPTAWADTARRLGLDFLAMTDHNVISQNFDLGRAAGSDVLLMAGEEMTNWFHGHATVTGIEVGDWLDWRQTPIGLPLPSGEPGARIQRFLAEAREMGAFVAAAHPLGLHLSWQFLADGDLDPLARPDSFEVWTGPFQPDDEAALLMWDERLRRGWRVWANGGTDLHGVENTNGFAAGTPTTVVYADQLSKTAIVRALKAGRCFVTRLPDGVELYLRAEGPGGQRQIVGGTIFGAPTDTVDVEVLVRRASGMRVLLLVDGVPISVTVIDAEEQRITVTLPIGVGGYVRVEARGVPEVDPTNPIAGRTDMEAFTNPIFFAVGPIPDDAAPVDGPPASGGPRRPAGAPSPGPGAAAGPGAGSGSGGRLPATGGAPTLAPAAALAALAAATAAVARTGRCVHHVGSDHGPHDHDHHDGAGHHGP